MKTLDVLEYERSYSQKEYLEAEDYSDLLTILSSDYIRASVRFSEFKLDKRQKSFSDDRRQEQFHGTAKQIEVGLDSSLRQFYAKLITPADMQLMDDKYFNLKFIKNSENNTPANTLRNKLTACKKFIEAFQDRRPLDFRKSYRYNNGRLSIDHTEYITFKLNSFRDTLMEILFRDFSVRHANLELIEEIAKSLSLRNETTADEDALLNKLKKNCEGINQRVTNKTKRKTKLIIHEKGITTLNSFAFDSTDRVRFVKNR